MEVSRTVTIILSGVSEMKNLSNMESVLKIVCFKYLNIKCKNSIWNCKNANILQTIIRWENKWKHRNMPHDHVAARKSVENAKYGLWFAILMLFIVSKCRHCLFMLRP